MPSNSSSIPPHQTSSHPTPHVFEPSLTCRPCSRPPRHQQLIRNEAGDLVERVEHNYQVCQFVMLTSITALPPGVANHNRYLHLLCCHNHTMNHTMIIH